MDSRWKAICTVGLILILLAAFHLYQVISFQRNHLQELIQVQQSSQNLLVRTIEKQIYNQYISRITSFSRSKPEVMEAFARRDREKLLALSQKYYEIFRKENPSFFIFHYFLPDNTTFLRVHIPDFYGDDLTRIRPIASEVNRTHKQHTGIEIGRMGIFYRVVQPVFFNDEYVGALEFGIELNQLLETMREIFPEDIGLLINKSHYDKATLLDKKDLKTCGHYVLLSTGSGFFAKIPADFDFDCGPEGTRISIDGSTYHLSSDLEIKNYQGYPIGKIIIATNITDHMRELQKTLMVSTITSVLLLILVLCLLYASFGSLMNKIFALNASLKKINLNLETTVRKRTLQLESEISERKLAYVELEEEMNQRQQIESRLEEEKELLSLTLRSIADAVISTDTSGKIVLMNRSAEELTGFDRKEAIGRPLCDVLKLQDEEQVKPCENFIRHILESEPGATFESSAQLLARDGGKINITESGAPIRNKKGVPIGVILVFRDVTGQKRLEEEMLKVEKLESIGMLAGGIAHDFNNILTAIMGNINLAAAITGPDHEIRDMMMTSENAVLRARDLTRQLLTFARGDKPVKQLTTLPELIEKSVKLTVSSSKIEYDANFAPGLWPVEIDRGQLNQVMQSMLQNACEAMENKGTLSISAENVPREESVALSLPPADYVKIMIKDSGHGIEEKDLPKIFDPYFSTKERGSDKGSGLGLAMAHSIIMQHEGIIRAESTPGSGAVFTIYLIASPQATVQGKEKNIHPETKKGKGKILVMDDEELVLDVAKMMLDHMGYEVELALDGRAVLDLYQKNKEAGRGVVAVIMDLTIPGGMGGEEAVQELLKIDPLAQCIVSSGYANDPIMANYKEYGFSGVLMKPFKVDELWRVLNRMGNTNEQDPQF